MNKRMRKPYQVFQLAFALSLLIFSTGCAALYLQNTQSSAGPLSTNTEGGEPNKPLHFQSLAAINLAEQAYEAQTVGEFTLADPATVTIDFALEEVDASIFDLRLITPAGDSLLILHSEDFRTDRQGGGQWEQNLPAGSYQLLLTAQASHGFMSLSWGHQPVSGE